MSNQVSPYTANTQVAALSADDYYAALAAEAEGYRGGGGGVLFLKMNGNTGYYSYGADDIDLPDGTQAAMNPRSLKRGWICWLGGQVKEEIMMSLEEGMPPAKHLLNDYGPYGKDDGWSEQKTIEFKTLDNEGLTLLFQANNKSKMNALEALMKDFGRNFRSYPGCVPIVELSSNSFETQPKDENGKPDGRKVKKFAPLFKIVHWLPEGELAALTEGAPADYDQGAEGEGEYVEEGAPADYDDQATYVEEEPAPAPVEPERPRGGRREPPAAAAAGRPANAVRQAPAPAAAPAPRPAAAPAARPAPAAAPAAPAGAAPRGRRF